MSGPGETLDYVYENRPHGFTPFDHQKTTSEFLVNNRKAFCFNEQGTGKTASVIWAVDYLMQLGLVKRVLVICPLSIMKSAWQQDLFKFAIHRTVSVAYGAAKKRKEIVNAGNEFVIVNGSVPGSKKRLITLVRAIRLKQAIPAPTVEVVSRESQQGK